MVVVGPSGEVQWVGAEESTWPAEHPLRQCLDKVVRGIAQMEPANASYPQNEDTNGDKFVDTLDCADVLTCWDRNYNGKADSDEDKNGDGSWDYLDCEDPSGNDGIDGIDGTNGTNGTNGAQGLQGDKGDKGDTGQDGAQGLPGSDGIQGAAIS